MRVSCSQNMQYANTEHVLLQELLHKKLDALQAGHDKSPSKPGSEGRTHVIASCVH